MLIIMTECLHISLIVCLAVQSSSRLPSNGPVQASRPSPSEDQSQCGWLCSEYGVRKTVK